jgi:hypothetical protein
MKRQMKMLCFKVYFTKKGGQEGGGGGGIIWPIKNCPCIF